MNLRERLLGNTFAYKTFKNLVSPPHLVAKTIEEFLQIADGLSVLDLGCGYGDIAHFYANRCKYVGIDSNESYIEEARRRNAHNDAEFIVGDVSDPEVRFGAHDWSSSPPTKSARSRSCKRIPRAGFPYWKICSH